MIVAVRDNKPADEVAQLGEHGAAVWEVMGLKPWPDQQSGSLHN